MSTAVRLPESSKQTKVCVKTRLAAWDNGSRTTLLMRDSAFVFVSVRG